MTVYLPLLIPVFAARLGAPEIAEPSEELRLTCVTYLTSVVDICAAGMTPYLSDMIAILQRTLVDPYPEVKKVWSQSYVIGKLCNCTILVMEFLQDCFDICSMARKNPSNLHQLVLGGTT